MASQTVEAKSLSILTTLASNPPAYPRNPTSIKQEPLVLYIARVPGSRDVFLTPMRPRDKVVSAEDVESSLYFLHIDQPEDEQLLAPPPGLPAGTGTSSIIEEDENPPPLPVRKNGLPAHSSNPGAPAVPPMIKRKPAPVATAIGSSNENGPVSRGQPSPNRRPDELHLSTIPSVAPYQTMSLQKENQAPLYPPRRHSEQPPPVARPPYPESPASFHPPPHSSENFLKPSAAVELPSQRLNDPSSPTRAAFRTPEIRTPDFSGPLNGSPQARTTLTLIRRDPSSGAQWNVAKIEDLPNLEVSSSAVSNAGSSQRKPGAPLYIEIMNPGYSKFLGTDDTIFKRRLWMEGMKYSDRNFGHRRMNSSDSYSGLNDGRVSLDDGSRTESPFQNREGQNIGTIQVTDKQSSFRGYVFQSPWNGRCEFSTGGGGSSLKCKHVLTGPQGPTAAPVSELRFNLPGSSMFSSTPKNDDASKRSSYFSKPHHSRDGSAASESGGKGLHGLHKVMDRLDLSLGQEMAGGGFGGKRAKLGKLIIDDEGLKMVDLLVAANLALWFRAYDRADSKAH